MQPEQQQRITAYFIDEAKDHLNTIEQGLLNLQGTIDDPEVISEVFRAAHSIKGGAAMLGFGGIQTVAHRLEDYFKILRESPIRSDQQLESLFLKVYDVLVNLVSQLERNRSLTDADSRDSLTTIEPTFTQLHNHLESLTVSVAHVPTAPAATSKLDVRSTMPEQSALLLTFQSDVPAKLREMLQLFKQGESPQTRQALQERCRSLMQVGEQFDLPRWMELLKLAQQAIADEGNSYRSLAQILIKEIKQSQDLVVAGQADLITPSNDFMALVPSVTIADLTDDEGNDLEDLLNIGTDSLFDSSFDDSTPAQVAISETFEVNAAPSNRIFSGFNGLDSSTSLLGDDLSDSLSTDDDAPGPEVDIVELNILADMFEGEVLDLGAGWSEEESFSGFTTDASESSEEMALNEEFDDLLFSNEEAVESRTDNDEIIRLFGDDTLIQKDDDDVDPNMDDDDLLGLESILGIDDNSMTDGSTDSYRQESAISLEDLELSENSMGMEFDVLDSVADELEFSAPETSNLTTANQVLDDALGDLDDMFNQPDESIVSIEADPSDAQPTHDNSNGFYVTDTLVEADPFSETAIDIDSSWDSQAGLDASLEFEDTQSQSSQHQANPDSQSDLDMDDLFGDDPFSSADADENLPEVVDFGLDLLDQPSLSGSSGDLMGSSDLNDLFDLAMDDAEDDADSSSPMDLEHLNLSSEILDEAVASTAQVSPLSSTVDDWQIPDNLFDEIEPLPNQANQDGASQDDAGLSLESFAPEAFATEAVATQAPEMDGLLEFGDLDFMDAEAIMDDEPDGLPAEEMVSSSQSDDLDGLLSFSLDDLTDSGLGDVTGLMDEQPSVDIEQSQTQAIASDSDFDDLLSLMDMPSSSTNESLDLDSSGLDINDSWLNDTSALALSDNADLDELGTFLEDEGSVSESSEFADLDSLLSDGAGDSRAMLATSEPSIPGDFADLDAMLDEPIVAPAPKSKAAESDFDDLEILLQDANRQLGGQPAAIPSRAMPQPRRPQKAADPTMRVPVKQLDKLNNLVGELVVNRNSLEQDQDRLRQFLDNLLYQVQQLSDVGQRMRDLYERSLLESSLLASRQAYQMGSKLGGAAANTPHSIGADFDALEMDRFTAFHSLSQEMIELIVRVRESASDIEYIIQEPMDQVTRNFRQVTTQLQEELNRARMVPFSMTADRLPRGVRDNAIREGKQAELVVEGRDTLIDKMILEQLSDPLTHLVNNAIAHGIEKPDVRQATGKPPTGRITVRAFHQGNQTVISVSDDGAGINPEFIKKKAIEKGLIAPAEAKTMSRSEVYEILFYPGFSGAEKLTDLAGRGVGMDVVRTTLNEIRGAISIDSSLGKGTTFTIRLPLTLSISKALCCISNRARIAFPMDGVEDMFDVPRDRVQTNAENQPCIPWRDTILPFQPLSDVLKFNRLLGRGSVYGGGQEDDIIPIVVLRSAGNFTALQVDQVMGEQEIVIKQLQGPVPKPMGIAGATVLGDGRIMPIADVLELIDLSLGRLQPDKTWDSDEAPPEPEDAPHEPTVLIVDDSITVRELLSMTFTKVGFRVEQARDGQDAWEKLRSGLPCDIVFCDIEMPRMDGLELLSRIQKDSTLNHLPIAMLTSRGADRHRQMAVQMGARGYFTKPYLEDVLLDAAQRMLKGEVLVAAVG